MTVLSAPPTPARTVGFTDLATHGAGLAVITEDARLSYAELADRVEAARRRLGGVRRLVLVTGANDLDTLVWYLGALRGGHVVMLLPGSDADHLDGWIDTFDPDVVVRPGARVGAPEERRPGTAHGLHPDLALLLGTSGSTGSRKLVRLSYANVESNAAAIAEYLSITADDRAVTTLPLHYCYGLSVVHSALTAGAGIVLTSRSVADPAFWELFAGARATLLAGVPYTFDLLDRVGFPAMDLPHLRCVTQAGGRLTPNAVRRYAELGQRSGWDFYVMYGQTEATARMAYLPPDRAASSPTCVGIPIPGGSIRLAPVDGADHADTGGGAGGVRPNGARGADRGGEPVYGEPAEGEIVYRGPNVMLGYAETPGDLAKGAELTELRTGDLGRRTEAGLFEIVGRLSRFAKVYGLRIDLGRVDAALEQAGIAACSVAGDDELLVAVERDADLGPGRRIAAAASGLPPRRVSMVRLPQLPRTDTGKVNLAEVERVTCVTAASLRTARTGEVTAYPAGTGPSAAGTIGAAAGATGTSAAGITGTATTGTTGTTGTDLLSELRGLYAEVLDLPHVDDPHALDDASFASLGGDSLSYVEMSVRLEERLGVLPPDWPSTPLRRLVPAPEDAQPPAAGSRRWRSVETGVALRATGILLVVGSHANVFSLLGAAHVLLAAVGYNFARLFLTPSPRAERVRSIGRAAARLAAPSVAWIAAVAIVTGAYPVATATLLNSVVGPDQWSAAWHFWFLETAVYVLVAAGLLLAVPALDRVERRHPFWAPAALLAVTLVPRFAYDVATHGILAIHRPLNVLWLVALGWAVARASRTSHRVLLTGVVLAAVPGLTTAPLRDGLILAGLLLLVWVPAIRVPAPVARAMCALASASLFIYLTHWQVYPHLENRFPLLALAASLAVGIAYSRLWPLLARTAADRARVLRRGPATSSTPCP